MVIRSEVMSCFSLLGSFFPCYSTFAKLVSWSVPSVEQKNHEKKYETALCAALLLPIRARTHGVKKVPRTHKFESKICPKPTFLLRI